MVYVERIVSVKVTIPIPKQTPQMLTEAEEHSRPWWEHGSQFFHLFIFNKKLNKQNNK